MKGTYPGPIQPLSAVIPGLEERPGQQPLVGQQRVVTVPLKLSTDAKTAASKTYKEALFIAPSDGWYVVDVFLTAVVVPDYASVTLAFENYDKSATTGNNLLSTTNYNVESLTAKQGTQMTLSATQANREMDEGDVIWTTLTVGATEVTAGEGISVTLVLQGPEIDPQ